MGNTRYSERVLMTGRSAASAITEPGLLAPLAASVKGDMPGLLVYVACSAYHIRRGNTLRTRFTVSRYVYIVHWEFPGARNLPGLGVPGGPAWHRGPRGRQRNHAAGGGSILAAE